MLTFRGGVCMRVCVGGGGRAAGVDADAGQVHALRAGRPRARRRAHSAPPRARRGAGGGAAGGVQEVRLGPVPRRGRHPLRRVAGRGLSAATGNPSRPSRVPPVFLGSLECPWSPAPSAMSSH